MIAAARPSPIALATIAAGGGLLLAAVVAAQYSIVAFAVIGLALVALLALASTRWPRALIVLVILSPILDRYLVGGLLPASVEELAHFFSEALLVGVGSVLLVRAARLGQLGAAFRHPVSLGLLALLAVTVLSALLNAVPPVVSAAGTFFTVDAIACFYLPRLVGFTPRQATAAIAVFVGLMLVATVVAIAQALLAPDILGLAAAHGRFGEVYRLASFLGDPNTFGAFLIAAAPFALFSSTGLAMARSRRIALLVAFLLVLALWLSFSRGAWLALVIGGGAVAALVDRRTLLVGAAVTALAFGTALFMPRDLLISSPAGGNGQTTTERPDLVDSTLGRFGTIGEGRDLRTRFALNAVPIFIDHPLLGVGPGRYGGAAADIFGTPVYEAYGTDELRSDDEQTTVDSFWLHLGIELGILGTLAYVAMLASVGLPALLGAIAARGRRRILLAGIIAATASIALSAVTTMALEGNSVAFTFWFLLGLASLLTPAWTDAEASPA